MPSDICECHQPFEHPAHYLLVCIPVCGTHKHTHRTRANFWHFQQLFSEENTCGLNLQWKILVSNICCIKCTVICFLELCHICGVSFLSYGITQIRELGRARRFRMHTLPASLVCCNLTSLRALRRDLHAKNTPTALGPGRGRRNRQGAELGA